MNVALLSLLKQTFLLLQLFLKFFFTYYFIWFDLFGFALFSCFSPISPLNHFGSGGFCSMYLHSDLTMRMFGTMQKCTHTHTHTHTLLYALTRTHTHTDSSVWSMRWCTALAIVFWLNAGGKWHWCVHLLSQYDVNIKSLDSSQPLSFISACCLIFAWAENGSSNVHCSCLSWGFGWGR